MPRAKNIYTTIVPLGYRQALENSELTPGERDQLARVAAWFLVQTASTEQYRKHWHLIDISKKTGRRLISSDWNKIQKLAVSTGLLEFRNSWSDGSLVGPYPRSAHFTRKYYTGRFEVYTFSRKPHGGTWKADFSGLGEVELWLANKLAKIKMPDGVVGSNVWSEVAIQAWRMGFFYAKSCNYGRLHSNATSLPRSSRHSLDCGEPMVELDIASCQPLILGAVLRGIADDHELGEWTALCESGGLWSWLEQAIKALGVDKLRVTLPAEYVTVNGKQVLGRRARSWEEDVQKWDRAKVKKSMLVMLFERVEETQASLAFRAVQQRFPSVAAAILEVKVDGHQRLAHKCQRFESDTVIRAAGQHMMQIIGDASAFTVHDAWIVPKRFQEPASAALKAVFKERRLNPTIIAKSQQQQSEQQVTTTQDC